MEVLSTVLEACTAAVVVLMAFRIVYMIIGLLSRKVTYKPDTTKRRYAVIVCARNEERVIGKLIESIHAQEYPADKIKIFVCADSCTDNTAKICREMGCVVYERFNKDPNKARKGYALEFLFDMIRVDYDICSFAGFAFFDADNVLAPTWLDKMNDAFGEDADIVATYRNTKNFDTNFISASYGIHFYRSTVQYHRPRRRLGLCTHLAGTGYVVRSELLKSGWHCTGLTEDAEFTQYIVASGKKVLFCEDAEFFDEQPHNFFVMWRQRLRWARGRLIVFLKYNLRNLKGIFTSKSVKNAWTNYDMFWYYFPGGLFAALIAGISALAGLISGIVAGTAVDSAIAAAAGLLSRDFILNIVRMAALAYAQYVINAALVVLRERKHIHCSTRKKIFCVFTFFWFDSIDVILSIIAVFMRVKWKPIVHDRAYDYAQVIGRGKKSEKDAAENVKKVKEKETADAP